MHLLHLARSWPTRRELGASLTDYMTSAPRPTGSRTTTAPGPDPVRVLLIGSGLAVGYGVTDRRDALDGHLARCLALRTGRGVAITNHADPTRSLMEQVFEAALWAPTSSFELVVWCPSAMDACSRRIPVGWATRLGDVLRLVGEGPRIVATTLPVAKEATADIALEVQLARELNADLVRVARGLPGVTVVEVPGVPLQSYGHPRFAGRYFAEVAECAAAVLAGATLERV